MRNVQSRESSINEYCILKIEHLLKKSFLTNDYNQPYYPCNMRS